MSNELIISSWNVCLGLTNKKDFIEHEIVKEKIDICCLQECEVPSNIDEKTLTFAGFKIELEDNDQKKRTGIYIRNTISYQRRRELEEPNCNIVIIDVSDVNEYRIINVYRSFSTYNNMRPIDKFINQLKIIKNAIIDGHNKIPIVIGDFNLDYYKLYDPNYQFKNYFEVLLANFEPLNLSQLVNFKTWRRFVNGVKRFSILDHFYTSSPEIVTEIRPLHTDIGDHSIILFTLPRESKPPKVLMKRDWRFYTKELLLEKLSGINFVMNVNCVQQTWNLFENELLIVLDEIIPIVPYVNDSVQGSKITPRIKTLINKKYLATQKLYGTLSKKRKTLISPNYPII